jgi:four helix bundle protein
MIIQKPAYKEIGDLVVYQRSAKLSREIVEVARTLDLSNDKHLSQHIASLQQSFIDGITESWDIRIEEKRFAQKLGDAKTNLVEIQHWLNVLFASAHITYDKHIQLKDLVRDILAMLDAMILNPIEFSRIC